MRPSTSGLAALVLVLAAAAPAHAQTCTTNQTPNSVASCSVSGTVGVTVGRAVALSLSNAATMLATPAVADVDAGLQRVATTGPTLTVKSNASWVIAVKALAATWTGGAGARIDKPAADLRWALSANGEFKALGATDTQLASGGATTGASYALFFKVAYNWLDDQPGTYDLPVVLTLTAP